VKIGEIFRYDLDREIKEVIKVDDADLDDVADEIGEYVVTEHIHEEFIDFLDRYQESILSPSETVNAWVSGFFGSGKSSFAKVLGYILANPTLGEQNAADLFTQKLPTQQIRALLNTIHGQAPTLSLFVDLSSARNVAREGESVVLPLYRELLTRLGYSRNLALAELEFDLEEQGNLQSFIAAFEEVTRNPWSARRDKALALNEASRVLHHLDPATYPSADSYARTRPQPEMGANLFAKRALDLLARRRPAAKRIVFIVDEVGQYVSRDVHRMLDLQGLAQACQKEDGRLWLVATGQETLEDVVGALGDKRVELARVRDRFPLSIDLVPSDIEEVVSKRVLAKNDRGRESVREKYDRSQNRLRANVSLHSPTRSEEFTGEEFTRVYPLLPYQIQLFIDAVSALRAHGGAGPMVGGANRTLIRLAHQLLKTSMIRQEVGALVTVPMAYDLMDEMIPGPWRGEIDQVCHRHGAESTETQVAKTVALISGVRALKLDEHNLAVLLHSAVEAETRRATVTAALEALVHEETLREGEDGYRLQSPQEKDWEKARRARELKTGDFYRLLRRDHLPSMLRGLTASASREFTVRVLFDDDKLLDGDLPLRIFEGRQDQVNRAVQRSRESAHENDVFLVFERSERTWRHAEQVFRSNEIIEDAEARSLDATETQLLHEERKRLDRAVRQLERALGEDMLSGALIFRGNRQPLEGRDLRSVLAKALGEHVNAIYTRLEEFAAPVRRTDAVTILRSDDLSGLPEYLGPSGLRVVTIDANGHRIDDQGSVAELVKAVRDRINIGSEPSGKYLEAHFQKPPYGAELDVVTILAAAAVRAGLVKVGHGGGWLTSRTDARLEQVFSAVPRFRSAVFRTREDLDLAVRSRVAKLLHHDLIGEKPGLATEDLAAFARQHLQADRERIGNLSAALQGLGLKLPETISRCRQTLDRMNSEDDESLVQSLDAARADLKDGIIAARELERHLDADRIAVLRRAREIVAVAPSELSETGRKAQQNARDILSQASYVSDFPELRRAVETIEMERQQAWAQTRERLEQTIDRLRVEISPLLPQVGEAVRDSIEQRLDRALPEDASFEAGPSRDALLARAADLTGLVRQPPFVIMAGVGGNKTATG
jgi:hypothetical protein